MEVTLNGEKYATVEDINVKTFLANLAKNEQVELHGCVFLLNDEVVKKDEYEDTFVKENDTIEVLSFVSGG